MDADLIARTLQHLVARTAGPLKLRFLLQPLAATIIAVRASRESEPRRVFAYIGRLCVVALFVDLLYQVIVLRWFYPGQALIVVGMLALVPFLVVRALMRMMRTARRRRRT